MEKNEDKTDKSPNWIRLYEIFLEKLSEADNAEEQLLEILPKVIDTSTTKELKEILEKNLTEKKVQKERLEQAFKELGEVEHKEELCEGITGIIKEFIKADRKSESDFIKDVVLISTIQKIQLYQIASYTTLRVFANALNFAFVANLLQKNLDEETDKNKVLSHLTEGTWFTSGTIAQAAKGFKTE